MSKRLFLLISLGAVLLLAGCITIDVHNVIRPDGSGEKVIIMAMDDAALEMAEMAEETPGPGTPEAEPENPFQDILDSCAEIPDATCEEYHDDEKEQTGVRAVVPFDSPDELIALSSSEMFGGLDEISFEQAGDVTTMHILVHTQDVGSQLAEEAAGEEGTPVPEATPSPEQQEQMRQVLEMMDIVFYYRVTAPGPIVDYSPQENATLEGNTVTWEIDLLAEEPSQELSVSYQAGGGPPPQPTQPPPPSPPAEGTPLPPPPTQAPPAGGEEGGGLCASCLPGLALPLLALSGVMAVRRKRTR